MGQSFTTTKPKLRPNMDYERRKRLTNIGNYDFQRNTEYFMINTIKGKKSLCAELTELLKRNQFVLEIKPKKTIRMYAAAFGDHHEFGGWELSLDVDTWYLATNYFDRQVYGNVIPSHKQKYDTGIQTVYIIVKSSTEDLLIDYDHFSKVNYTLRIDLTIEGETSVIFPLRNINDTVKVRQVTFNTV